MADPVRLSVGDVVLTRVEYFDIALDPDGVALTSDDVAGVEWAVPTWATPAGQVLVGQAMWVVESCGTTIVVDPCGASDAFLRTGPEAITHQEAMLASLAAAGFAAAAIDIVLLTHLDGIGIAAVVNDQGGWSPAFPGARVVLTRDELAFLADPGSVDVNGNAILAELSAQGVVDGVAGDHAVTDEVSFELTGAHSTGHAVVRVRSGDEQAILVGHLAVSPLHVATGVCPGLHREPEKANQVLGELVAEAAATGALLVGPLWPHPGAGRVAASGAVVPVET